MPPKKGAKGAEKPKSQKVEVDKSFGMKNKKGGAAQKQIKQMKASGGSDPEAKRKAAEKEAKLKEKKAAEDAKREADALLNKEVQIQKVPFGVDPKTVLCIFFKKGNCDKGKRCKFAHDLSLDRKTDKKNLYADTREDEKEEKKKETSDDWDEEKLRKVVLSKKGNQQTTTDKVCKFFISAIEDGKYGWFWVCPNGGDQCKYKHALPPGFILKTKEQRAAEKALLDKSPLKTLTLEDFLESERHKLTGTLTPVTPETFAKWKKDRMDKKAAEDVAKKAKDATGRAMFESGNWRTNDESESEDDEDDEAWNLEKLRAETEAIRDRKEAERVAREAGYNPADVLPPEDTGENAPEETEEENSPEEGEASGA